MQQLPSNEITRSCFTAVKGNKWCSCDYSAIESRLGADIYNEESYGYLLSSICRDKDALQATTIILEIFYL